MLYRNEEELSHMSEHSKMAGVLGKMVWIPADWYIIIHEINDIANLYV